MVTISSLFTFEYDPIIRGFMITATIPPVAGARRFTTMTLAGPKTLGSNIGELPPLKNNQAAHKKRTPYNTIPAS